MKSILTGLMALLVVVPAFADKKTDAENSKKIEAAVKVLAKVAERTDVFQVRSGLSVKETILAVCGRTGDEDESCREYYDTTDKESWGADTMRWSPTDMKAAYSYIFNFNFKEDRFGGSEDPDADMKKLAPALKKAREAFGTLMGTGVEFGVAPIGAVQCGVTFAALLVINKYNGKVHVIVMEGSGC